MSEVCHIFLTRPLQTGEQSSAKAVTKPDVSSILHLVLNEFYYCLLFSDHISMKMRRRVTRIMKCAERKCMFFSLIYDNIVLVSRALRNQFIIPDWESFTVTIRGFYDKVKAMDSVGHVSNLHWQTARQRHRVIMMMTSTNQPTSPSPLPRASMRPFHRRSVEVVWAVHFCLFSSSITK